MRYIITFKDGSTLRVSQPEGEAIAKAVVEERGFILRGAAYDKWQVATVKPINREHFDRDFVEQQRQAELNSPTEQKYLR